MKWNNRLKTVLTHPRKSEISGECLKTQLTKADKSQLKLVSSVCVSDELRHSPKNNNELADFKAEKFHTVLNRFIEKGITFDVSATNFQIIDRAQILKTSDKQFLQINNAAILCHLQQSLLMKHLFSHSPELLEDFSFEIMERESLLTIPAKTLFEIYFEAVRSITLKWFNDLLNEGEN